MTRRTNIVARSLAIAAAACTLGQMGCYRRTVGARGFGADSVSISEPNGKDTVLDRAVEPKPKATRRQKTPLDR